MGSRLNINMLAGANVICTDEVVWQGVGPLTARRRIRIDEGPISEQFVRQDVHLLFGFPAFTNDIPAIKMGEGGFNTVTGVIRERQADRAGGCDRGVVAVAGPMFRDLVSQCRIKLLHIATVFGDEHGAADSVSDLIAILGHLRALSQHLWCHLEGVEHNGCWPFFTGEF